MASPHHSALRRYGWAAGCTCGRNRRREFEYVKRTACELLVRIMLEVPAIVIFEDGYCAHSNPVTRVPVCGHLAVPSLRLRHDERRVGKRRPVEFDRGQPLFPHKTLDLR
jgi:hypothetical protein